MQSDLTYPPPLPPPKPNLKEKPETNKKKQNEESSCGGCGETHSSIYALAHFSCKLPESTFFRLSRLLYSEVTGPCALGLTSVLTEASG